MTGFINKGKVTSVEYQLFTDKSNASFKIDGAEIISPNAVISGS